MCFTSPPYNQGGKAKRLPAFYKGEGDNKTKDEYFEFLISIFLELKEVMNPDAPLLWNVSYNSQSRDDYGRIVFSNENPFRVMETIMWDKKHGFNISARGILSRDSELIFLMCHGEDYFTNQGRYDTWYNTWRVSTIGAQTEGHGAAFPAELVETGLNHFSPDGAIVIDPFIGTGTTLIACQSLGRKCRAIEISPAYCAVTLERMSTAFPGIEIERIDTVMKQT
jgi:DNA modification methylase